MFIDNIINFLKLRFAAFNILLSFHIRRIGVLHSPEGVASSFIREIGRIVAKSFVLILSGAILRKRSGVNCSLEM